MLTACDTAPAGNSIVRPVSGIEMIPPDWSIVLDARTAVLSDFFHQTALRSRPAVLVGAPSMAPELAEPEFLAASASTGVVGLVMTVSAQDAIRATLASAARERRSLVRSIGSGRVEVGLGRSPKATDVPDRNCLFPNKLRLMP